MGDLPTMVESWLLSRAHMPAETDAALVAALADSLKVRDDELRGLGYFSGLSGNVELLHAPEQSYIDIHDIASVLSRLPRWGGRTRADLLPYSVAQHSVMVSKLCRPENALIALLHDATEAYLGDVISPMKRILPQYQQMEELWALAIGERFGLGDRLHNLPADVKCADLIALELERHDLLVHGETWHKWGMSQRPTMLPRIRPEAAPVARSMFMSRFNELATGG